MPLTRVCFSGHVSVFSYRRITYCTHIELTEYGMERFLRASKSFLAKQVIVTISCDRREYNRENCACAYAKKMWNFGQFLQNNLPLWGISFITRGVQDDAVARRYLIGGAVHSTLLRRYMPLKNLAFLHSMLFLGPPVGPPTIALLYLMSSKRRLQN